MYQFTFKNQHLGWRHICLNKLIYVQSTIKRNSLSFYRYNKAFGVGVILLGPFQSRVILQKISEKFQIILNWRNDLLDFDGIRALTIANLTSSAYGSSLCLL